MYGETVGSISVSSTGYLITRTVNPSNKTEYPHTRIFHIHLISGGTASQLLITNGLGGTQKINVTGTANKGIDFDFGVFGISFPLGAYITVDANISNAEIVCKADVF